METSILCNRLQETAKQVESVLIGQQSTIRYTLAALLAGGHVLLEDVPGTGKTTLANTVSSVLGLDYTRIQGTPDLLPGEVTGTMVFHPSKADFEFKKGPIFTQLLLFDEINRATPRTQSALLEAMAERHVTVDGHTYPLGNPFFVIATANPLESQGVFPLPEAQLDRFLIQIRLGYIQAEEEFEMVRRIRFKDKTTLFQQMNVAELLDAQEATRSVFMHDEVLWYIIRLCRATREHESILLGVSPRSILALTSFSQALALLSGRSFVTPDDVKEAWIPVMNHRIHMKVTWDSHADAHKKIEVLKEIVEQTMVPTELVYER